MALQLLSRKVLGWEDVGRADVESLDRRQNYEVTMRAPVRASQIWRSRVVAGGRGSLQGSGWRVRIQWQRRVLSKRKCQPQQQVGPRRLLVAQRQKCPIACGRVKTSNFTSRPRSSLSSTLLPNQTRAYDSFPTPSRSIRLLRANWSLIYFFWTVIIESSLLLDSVIDPLPLPFVPAQTPDNDIIFSHFLPGVACAR